MKTVKENQSQILPDLISNNLDILVCGTAAGPDSAKSRKYYANKGNQFYSILAKTNLTPLKVEPENYSELINYGIGLTDLSKYDYGTDNQINEKRQFL